MQELIGELLEVAITKLEQMGISYTIVDNNFNVNGDTKIVTNIITKDKNVILITGDFIFNLEERGNE